MRAIVQLCILLYLATALSAGGDEWTVTTLGGRAGAGSFDGNGRLAAFNNPAAVAVDASGNVYVADAGNRTIRKIAPNGDVFTLAGLAGQSGFVNASGSAVRFKCTAGIAVDGAGNVYVSDCSDCRIRKVTSAGAVTTFAGSGSCQRLDGTGTTAAFDTPGQMAIDGGGNLYLTERGAIRRITPSAVVTTLLVVTSPQGIAVDPQGTIYFTSTGYPNDYRIQKISGGSAVVVAGGDLDGAADGTGTAARFGGTCSLVSDSSGNIYASDPGSAVKQSAPTIRRITSGGVVTTVAGSPSSPRSGDTDGTGPAALFSSPAGLAVDGAGNIYVADSGNKAIRKITAAGVVTTLAGNSDARFAGPDGPTATARFWIPVSLTLDSSGNAFIVDWGGQRFRKLTAAGIVSSIPGTWDYLKRGLVTDAQDNVWFGYKQTIRKLTSSGTMTIVAGDDNYSDSVDGSGASAHFRNIESLGRDDAGNIYVSEDGTYPNQAFLRKLTAAGVVTTVAGSSWGCVDGVGSAAQFDQPVGVASANGSLYIANSTCRTIRRIAPGGSVTTFAGQSGVQGTVDGAGSAAQFQNPKSLTVDAAGNLYAGDNQAIRRITASGVVTTLVGSNRTPAYYATWDDGTGSAANLGNDLGLAFGPNGVLYIADAYAGRIRTARPAIDDKATVNAPTVTRYTVAQLDTTPQTATSWSWQIVRRPAGSTAQLSSTTVRNPTFAPDVADLYTFQLTASSAAGIRISYVDLNVSAVCNPLTAVSASISGATSICDLATGGTATATASNGGAVTYQWGWRATSSGTITNISGATSSTYTIHGSDFGITGTVYLVCTVKPECGSTMTTSNIALTVNHSLCSTIKGDVNGDGILSVSDVFYLINHLFAGGPGPIGPADVNADAAVSVSDIFYLINHLFAGGPAPK